MTRRRRSQLTVSFSVPSFRCQYCRCCRLYSNRRCRRRYRAGEVGNDDAKDWRHLRSLPPHDDAERITAKSPRFAEAVVQIPDVMLLHQVRIVAEDCDHWRRSLDLRGVIQLDLATRCLRWLAPADDLFQRGALDFQIVFGG